MFILIEILQDIDIYLYLYCGENCHKFITTTLFYHNVFTYVNEILV